MILIVGATGILGGMITQRLLAQGKEVRILVRPDSPAAEMSKQGMATDPQSLIDAGASVVSGDLRDPASLEAACNSVESVITTANAALRDGDFEAVDLEGTLSLIDAANAAGVDHFIYISAYGADPQHPHPLFSAKGQCEARLEAGDLAYTVLSPNFFMETWVGAVVGIPLRSQQPITLLGQGTRKHAFVSIGDVAAYAAMAVDNPAARFQTIPLAAAKSHSWNDVVATVEQVIGLELSVNYVAIGEPIPLIPETMVPILSGVEMAESFIDMRETSRKYGIEPTSLGTVVKRMFS